MIRKEGSAEGFLGVDVKSLGSASAPRLHLTQAGLAKRIVDALGLCSTSAYDPSLETLRHQVSLVSRHVHSRRVRLLKIESRNQLSDLFTKGLPAPAFSHLRSLLMGW
eukprot:CCRYP_012515-RA/>CCRYP_012515-RA protein AED:0.49 eAED:0.49 QI:0/0/0/1/0/0/2/0/107